MTFSQRQQQVVGHTVPPWQGDVQPAISEEYRDSARRTVSQYATRNSDSSEEARQMMSDLMLMLGIFPGQEDEGFQVPNGYRNQWCGG